MASPLLRHFTVETSNAYQTPSPEVLSFSIASAGSESTPKLLSFTAETSNAYITPSPEVLSFSIASAGSESTPKLLSFTAETSNAYITPSPEVLSFSIASAGSESTPKLLSFTAEAGHGYLTPSPEVLGFSTDFQIIIGGGMGLRGKQVVLGTIPDNRLEVGYIRADGGRASTANQDMGAFRITNLALPTALTDAATRGYVDGAVALYTNASSPVTLTTATKIVYLDTSGGAITLNLPALAGSDNHEFIIHTLAGGSNNVTLDPNGSETIADQGAPATTLVYTGLVTKRLRAKGTGANQSWYVFA